MFAYVLRRLAATIPVMLIVAVLVFLMLRLTPADPAAIIAGDTATTEQIAEIRKRLGLEEPILTQFAIWMTRIAAGRLRRIVLLQEAGGRADPRPARADAVAGARHHRPGGSHRRAARRDRRLSPRRLARPHRHGVLGAGLLGAGVRDRLSADLRVRGPAQLAAGAGLPAHRPGGGRLAAAADPAVAHAVRDLYRADRAHHPHQRARGA